MMEFYCVMQLSTVCFGVTTDVSILWQNDGARYVHFRKAKTRVFLDFLVI